MESSTMQEEGGSDPELLKVKVRLDALEEAVKEIVDETKKLSTGMTKDPEGGREDQHTNLQNISKPSSSAADNQHGKSIVGELTPDVSGDKVREFNATAGAPQAGNRNSHESKKWRDAFFFLVSIDISTGDSEMQYVVKVLSHCPKNTPSE